MCKKHKGMWSHLDNEHTEFSKNAGELTPLTWGGGAQVDKYLFTFLYLRVLLFAQPTKSFLWGCRRSNININFVSLFLYFISLKQAVNLPSQNWDFFFSCKIYLSSFVMKICPLGLVWTVSQVFNVVHLMKAQLMKTTIELWYTSWILRRHSNLKCM